MRSRSRGFSLIEVVVAAAILGFSLVAAYEVFGTGLRGAAAVDRQAKALVILDGLTAQLGSVYAIEPGTRTGRAQNGFHWNMQMTPYEEDVVGPGRRLGLPNGKAQLLQVDIEISGPSGVILDVTTLRLSPVLHEG